MQDKIILGIIWVIDGSRVSMLFRYEVKVTMFEYQRGSPAVRARYQLVEG